MSKISAAALGTQPIGPLLVKQAVPASIGILVMSLNVLVDSIFVGNWIGALGIAPMPACGGMIASGGHTRAAVRAAEFPGTIAQ